MNISALSFRDFRIYLVGNLFASNALWMQRVTVGWIAWDLTSSAAFVGFVAFANFAPSMIAGPLFGVLIDRVKVKHAALVTQFLSFVIALGFYVFFVFGILDELVILLLSAFSGLIVSAHAPVRMSLAPRLVDRASVASVITLGAINFNLARLTGPAVGGWLIAFWGVSAALFIQVLCYLPFLFAISLLQPRERSSSETSKEAFLTALNSGIRLVRKSPLICQALLITALYSFLIRGALELLPVIADGLFSKGATGLGLLTSCAGFGALLAGMAKALLPSQITGRDTKICPCQCIDWYCHDATSGPFQFVDVNTLMHIVPGLYRNIVGNIASNGDSNRTGRQLPWADNEPLDHGWYRRVSGGCNSFGSIDRLPRIYISI